MIRSFKYVMSESKKGKKGNYGFMLKWVTPGLQLSPGLAGTGVAVWPAFLGARPAWCQSL